jgi:hypothetical protein
VSVLLLLSPEMAKMCKSAARGFASPFRQGGELAEGQKGENVKDIRAAPPPFYESPSSVKKERTVAAPVNLPFFYPSIGVSLAPVGCFEVALAAPSPNEPKAQGGVELASTSTGLRSLVPFFSLEALEKPSYRAGPTAIANSPEDVFIS